MAALSLNALGDVAAALILNMQWVHFASGVHYIISHQTKSLPQSPQPQVLHAMNFAVFLLNTEFPASKET